MSYCFDTQRKAWAALRAQLPQVVQDSELAHRFEILMEEMHEANHRLRDAVNHDHRVTERARRLDDALATFHL